MARLLRRLGAWLRADSPVGPDQIVPVSLGSDLPRTQLIVETCRSEGLVVELEPHVSHAYPFLGSDQRMLVRGADLAAAEAIIADIDAGT
ncbi:MAG TPA: hypothetical protein VEW93_15535 [Acidimicrobiales bacterium]|nr:hypothetical protein [Acidimicrobiales bacterium]